MFYFSSLLPKNGRVCPSVILSTFLRGPHHTWHLPLPLYRAPTPIQVQTFSVLDFTVHDTPTHIQICSGWTSLRFRGTSLSRVCSHLFIMFLLLRYIYLVYISHRLHNWAPVHNEAKQITKEIVMLQ